MIHVNKKFVWFTTYNDCLFIFAPDILFSIWGNIVFKTIIQYAFHSMGFSFSVGGVLIPLIGWFADSYGLTATMELLTIVAICAAIFSLFLPKR
ncbi:hypothetical protein [Pectinatus frisingensis]|uniref:hypothetical protein n=1 Tax=Pectinatus frisingensis TaxID=865 RepID=UPI001E59038A|nr:hypothetical protein [Pectinatus frisingensis]